MKWSPICNMQWRARLFNLPGLFTGYHQFILQPSADGLSTDFEHYEILSGVLSYVLKYVKPSVYSDMEVAFNAMNDGLKRRAASFRD